MNKKQNVLITGGAGFIGTALCKRLVQNKNLEIFSLDNYFTGSSRNHVKDVHYIEGHTSQINKLVNFEPDIIYHFGEYSRVEQSFTDRDIVVNSNVLGTLAVVEFALRAGSKIIYAGSSTKFGDDGEAINSSPYAFTKANNTQLICNYGKWFGLKYAIAYFYNVYGEGEIRSGKYATLIGIFSECVRKNKALPVVSPGSQERNFTHISDTVSALELIGHHGIGDNYGIASDESFSVLEVAEIFGQNYTMLPPRRGNRLSARVVSDKTKALGWEPKVKLRSYVSDLVLKIKG